MAVSPSSGYIDTLFTVNTIGDHTFVFGPDGINNFGQFDFAGVYTDWSVSLMGYTQPGIYTFVTVGDVYAPDGFYNCIYGSGVLSQCVIDYPPIDTFTFTVGEPVNVINTGTPSALIGAAASASGSTMGVFAPILALSLGFVIVANLLSYAPELWQRVRKWRV